MSNNVSLWSEKFLAETDDTLFGQSNSRHIAVNFSWARSDMGKEYTRKVLHISAVPCQTLILGKDDWKWHTPNEFGQCVVFCTDGKTIGHHLPGECPFMVKKNA